MPKPCYTAESIGYKWLSGCVKCKADKTDVKLKQTKQISYEDAEKLCDHSEMTRSCFERLITRASYRNIYNETKGFDLSQMLWTGVTRYNETHFRFKDGMTRIPEHQLCDGYPPVYPFRSSVILTYIKNGSFIAVSKTS